MKKILLAMIALTILSAPALADKIPTTSPKGHEAIKAEVEDARPSHFTIDVKKLANADANQEAKTFALYTSDKLPDTCGNFADTKISYEKPEEYKRVFNLTKEPEVLAAIKQYKCVVIPNIPPSGS